MASTSATARFDDNLVDGLVMHRYVTNAVVDSSTANGNAGDGIVLSRATTGIVLSEIEAKDNHRNGLTMSGLPLADGPSATGSSVDQLRQQHRVEQQAQRTTAGTASR